VKRLPADSLRWVMNRILRRRGLSERHAADVADGLLRASLRGIDTHGVNLFPLYVRELEGGRAAAKPALTFAPAGKAARLLDAGGALGVVAGMEAARAAVELARDNGVAGVAVANSNHFAAASIYTLAIADRQMIGLSFSNSDALVAPFNGHRPFFGTNPLSFAAPCDGTEPFCIDMATSQVAYSKVRRLRDEGGQLEPGWALDSTGRDAAEAEGDWTFQAMQPLGGYKGQCLNMLVLTLCALLTEMPFDHELSHLYAPPYDAPRRVSHFLMAVDIAAFVAPERFRQRLDGLLTALRGQSPIGAEPVIAPGDKERRAAAERLAAGVPVPDSMVEAFSAFFREAAPGQAPPWLDGESGHERL